MASKERPGRSRERSGARSSDSTSRQRPDGGDPERSQVGQRAVEADMEQYDMSPSDEPDVILDVPQLEVDEISLEVDNLQARIAVQAKLAELVQLSVGADVEVERVALQITGVEAQALLKARLDNVRAILDRALTTVDRNPDLLRELVHTADDTVAGLDDTAEDVLGRGGAVSETAQQVTQTGRQAAGELAEPAAEAEEELEGDYEEEEGYEEEPEAEADEEFEEEYEEEPEAEADEELGEEYEDEPQAAAAEPESEEAQERSDDQAGHGQREAGQSGRRPALRRPNGSGSRSSPPRPTRPPRAGGSGG
jgi:hypothetical protein